MSEPSVEELLADIARILVDKPQDVLGVATSGENGTVLRLKVDPTDVGRSSANKDGRQDHCAPS